MHVRQTVLLLLRLQLLPLLLPLRHPTRTSQAMSREQTNNYRGTWLAGARGSPQNGATRHGESPSCLARHWMSSLSSAGGGHGRKRSSGPKVYRHAALAATRPKTTQSSSELPPKRLF